MTDETYDVVILGSGIAGLAGALAAHEKGLRPIVIEKADRLGGGTANSYGLIWVGGNHIARQAGIEDSPEDILRYMHFLAGGEHHEPNLLAFVDRSPEVLRFFEDCGIRFRLAQGIIDHYYGIAPGARKDGRSLEAELISGFDLGDWKNRVRIRPNVPSFVTVEEQVKWGGVSRVSHWDKDLVRDRQNRDMRGKGLGLICHFLKVLLARQVPISCNEVVERLLFDGSRVSGVLTRSGRRISATHGVILATGCYGSNPDLVKSFDGLPDWLSQVPPSLTGDGMVLGAEIGAAIHVIRNNMHVSLFFPIPSDHPGDEPEFREANIVELCSPHTMVVNDQGMRFSDETFFQGMVPALRNFDPALHRYVNLPCYLIFDQAYAAKYSFAGREAGAAIPPWVPRDTLIRGLAGKLGIDADGLAHTVDRFNGFARSGADPDFRRGEQAWRLAHDRSAAEGANQSLGPIAEPPFYGVALRPTALCSAGLLTNERAQVMHQRRHPIAGLYATGNTAAKLEFGAGYQAGMTLASAMTFSYLAVENMLRQANQSSRQET